MQGILTRTGVVITIFLIYLSMPALSASVEEDKVVCNGKVIDIPEIPVPDAYIFLYEMVYDTTNFEIRRNLLCQARSDSDGRFQLTTDRRKDDLQQWGTILVAAKDRGIRWASWNLQHDKAMVFKLERFGKLSGRIFDESGQTVKDASIRALLMLPHDEHAGDIHYFDHLTERTDETGRFTFNFIPSDATADFYITNHDGISYCTAQQGIVSDKLSYGCGEHTIEIALSDKLAMENSVRSISYGTMLANSRFIQKSMRRIETASLPKIQPSDIGVHSISGIIIEEPFIPLPDVTISIYDVFEDNSQPFGFAVKAVGKTTTDSFGKYVFERTDYNHKIDHGLLIAHKEGYSLFVKSFTFTNPGLEPLVMEFGHKGYTGRVVDTSGNPVVGARVSAYVSSFISLDNEIQTDCPEAEAARTEWLTSTTDGDGEFTISHIPLFAKAEFSIEAEGYSTYYTFAIDWLFLMEMTIPAGGDPLLFTLEKACAVQGQLVDEQTGVGIGGEKIYIRKNDVGNSEGVLRDSSSGTFIASDAEVYNRRITTDQQGHFSADHLMPGTYRISLDPFLSNDRKWHVDGKTVDVSEGETVDVTLSAATCQAIRIHVQGIDGQSVPGADVTLKSMMSQDEESIRKRKQLPIYFPENTAFAPGGSPEAKVLFQVDPSGEMLLPVKTDKDGIAVFRLGPGDYVVEAVQKQNYEFVRKDNSLHVDSGEDLNITVQVKPLPGYQGICISLDGDPVADATVKQLGSRGVIATTDQNGSFQLEPERICPVRRLTGQSLFKAKSYFIRQLTADRTRYSDTAVGDVTLQPTQYRGQELILLVFNAGLQQGGWLRYNWDRHFEIPLKPTIAAKGQVTNKQGSPLISTVRVYASRNKTRIQSTAFGVTFEETNFVLYDEKQTGPDGQFGFQLIPEFIYLLEATAEGYGKVVQRMISTSNDPELAEEIQEGRDYIIHEDMTFVGPHVLRDENVYWILRESKPQMDLGIITISESNLALSGILVDSMGSPLEGYRVFVSGIEQVLGDESVMTDKAGRFMVTGLCEGQVEVYAEKGEYDVRQPDITVGRPDLRIVCAEHPPSSNQPIQTDGLCDFEIVLLDQDTQYPIQIKESLVSIYRENGDEFSVKLDDKGRYRMRVEEGRYTINVEVYWLYSYKKSIPVEVKPGQDNVVSIPLKKCPIIEGIIHLPETVSTDDLEVDIQPERLLRLGVLEDDIKIAGDGQFTFKIMLGQDVPSHGWLWICTKDKKYVSRTKFSLDEQWVEITLLPEATVKFKKSEHHPSIMSWGWNQEEYNNDHTWSVEKGPKKDVLVQDEEYIGIHGLVPGQDDLTYTVMIHGLSKPIKVSSNDLVPGEVKIVEIPSP